MIDTKWKKMKKNKNEEVKSKLKICFLSTLTKNINFTSEESI